MFEPVDPGVSFPEEEERILAFWREADVFHRSLRLREGAPEWVFYEGPPTANGRPGIHHAEARTFKDVYPRFKTMTGHYVHRKAGWDCHGLPVELEVEKEIGTTGKRDIEAFGVAEFNRRCRESVTRYVEDWVRLTERIGFWIDMSEAYWTMDTDYVESVWWSLKELHRNELLFEDHKVTPYCPRCGTALSDHEVALGYRQAADPSLFLGLPIVEAHDPELVGARIVVWTTTPWTLISNLGLAVAPDQTYELVSRDGERLVIAERLRHRVLGEGWTVEREFAGVYLTDDPVRYEPPYPNVEDGSTHRVVAADFVSMEDGSGVVHVAPAFGAEDLDLGRAHGWPVYRPVDEEGRFTDEAPGFVRGRTVKEADPDIIEELRSRGLVIRDEVYEHTYPFCWRCDTPLIYYARTAWYVGTTQRKERLLAVNESVDWYPEHIKHGRYGDWLQNNVDWALSRDRYWGTPLPLWRCAQGHVTAVGSLRELSELAGRDLGDLDPHKPYIDEVTFDCPGCGEEARRVPEVIDTWYDSGAMPFAQWGYHPELGRGLELFERRFPADFISEAIDQTRGWFYSLMAESTLLFDQTSYRSVVCLGLLVDRDGRKMSKRLGNIVDPWDVLDRHGADALRWFLIAGGSPWASRRVYLEAFDEVVRQFLLTLRNVHAFFVTYANTEGFDPSSPAPAVADRPALDRWILSQLDQTARTARDGLEAYDATGAARRIERFVDDLSNWYVRRSRRRFWNPGGEATEDAAAAFHTLYECLVTTATLLAPITPFIGESLWRSLAAGREGRPESVHLVSYPDPGGGRVDAALDEAMAAARDIVGLGRTVRTDAKVRVRQPLHEAIVHYPGDHDGLRPLLGLVAEELNVKRVGFAESAEELGRWRAKPNYRALGPRLGGRVKLVAEAMRADEGELAGRLARGETVELDLGDGEPASLSPEDVDLVQETTAGWGVAAVGGLTVALELELTPELLREGWARELVRLVQDARKAAGLEVTDRIELGIEAAGDAAEALQAHRDYVARETLAVDVTAEALADADHAHEIDLQGTSVRVTLRKV